MTTINLKPQCSTVCVVKENDMSNVIVFGATGLLGQAVVRANPGCTQISSKDFDATDRAATKQWFIENTLLFTDSTVHLCTGKVCGIGAQKHRVMFEDNLMMTMNLVRELAGHQKIGYTVFYSSSVVYPAELEHMTENDMFTGAFSGGNDGYALGKAAGQRYCQYWNREREVVQFVSAVIPNIWGEGDNWDMQTAHVMPAVANKMQYARMHNEELTVFGAPEIRREFLRADDVASAVKLILASGVTQEVYNIGHGHDISIGEIVEGLKQRLAFNGPIEWTGSNGGPTQRLMKCEAMEGLGWRPTYTYEDMLDFHADHVRGTSGVS